MMFFLNFLIKLSILSIVLLFLRLPILNPILIFLFFFLLIFVFTGEIRRFNKYSFVLSIISIIIFSFSFFFSFPKIHEGHNYLIFVEDDSKELKKALPENIYELAKERFNLKYPEELQCDKEIYGCWRFFGDIKRPFSFSADGFWQKTDMSRIVYEISSNELLKSRTGFLNTLAPNGDTISNWYSDRFSNKNPNRKDAPYFVKWRFPENAKGKLCTKGNIAKKINNKNFIFEFNSNINCITLNKNILPIELIGLQFDQNDSFSVSYDLSNKLNTFKIVVLLVKILSCLIFVFSWIKPRYNFALPIYGISFLSNFVWGGEKLFQSHYYLFLDGVGDPLLHWGFGKWITESIKLGNLYEAFLGVENIYYFMPGYRYFRSLEMVIFGESSILTYFSVILMPSLLYFILRKFLPALHSLISIIILLIIVPSYAESVSHYPESIGYFFALLGIIFGITNSESNDDIFKNIFLCSFFFGLSIFVRPNLLPASLLFIAGFLAFSKPFPNYKVFIFSALGIAPAFFPLMHNLFFGNEFVILTKAATIKENILAPPGYWSQAFFALINGDWNNEKLIYILNHFARYILGPGGIILLLSIIMLTILTPILLVLKRFQNFIRLLYENFNKNLILLSLYWLGLQIMLIFYHPANRYAVMSALISLVIFIVIAINSTFRKHGKLTKKINFFEEKELLNYPKDFTSKIVQIWPLGKFPFASGTFCSVFFFILGYYINLRLGWEYTLLLSILLIFLGLWFTKKYIGQNINSDPKEVVIDEAAGQLIASASAGINIYLHLLSFLLFRFFDITKLGPIKFIENKGGAFGIIFDDVLAGIFSALIILFIINFLI